MNGRKCHQGLCASQSLVAISGLFMSVYGQAVIETKRIEDFWEQMGSHLEEFDVNVNVYVNSRVGNTPVDDVEVGSA